MTTTADANVPAILSEALFASNLQSSWLPTDFEIRTAIGQAKANLGVRGCLERVAQEFGDHPELAVSRMRWATEAVARLASPSLSLAA